MGKQTAYSFRKKITLFLILMGLSVLILQGGNLFLSLTEHLFRSRIQKKLGGEFHAKSAYFSQGALCFENSEIGLGKKGSISIEKLLIKPHWNGSFSLTFFSPEVHLSSKNLSSDFKRDSSLDKIQIEVFNGRVTFDDENFQAFFSLKESPTETSLSLQMAESSFFDLLIKKERGGLSYNLAAENFILEDFSPIFSLLHLPSFKGKISGSGHFSQTKGNIRDISIDAEGENIQGHWKGMEISLRKAELSLTNSPGSALPQLYSFLFGKTSLPESIRFQFEEGSLRDQEWNFSSLKGLFSYHKEVGLKTEIAGSLSRGEWTRSFLWEGKGIFTSPFQNWIQSQISLGNEDESFSLHLEEKDNETIQLQLASKKMPAEMGGFFLSLIKEKFSFANEIIWEKGSASFSAGVHFQKEKTASFDSIHLEAKEIGLRLPEKRIQFDAKKLFLEGKDIGFDLQKSSLLLLMEEGALHSENEKNEISLFDQISCSFKIAEGKVHPSHIHSYWNGRENEWLFSGSWDNVTVSFQAYGNMHEISLFLPKGENFPPPKDLETAKGEFALKATAEGYGLKGGFQIQKNDEFLDQVSLFLRWKKNEPLNGITGWIEGKKIATNRFLFSSKGERFFLDGDADFLIHFKEGILSAQLQAENFSYRTSTLQFYLPKLEGESFSFIYNFLSKESKLSFPFAKASVTLPVFNVLFSQAEGDFLWENSLLHVFLKETESEGVKLGGDVEFDFANSRLDLFSHFLDGSIESGKCFFSHFTRSFFTSLPLKGKLSSSRGGFFFSTVLGQREPAVWGLKLKLEEGSMQLNPTAAICNFHGDLEWDSEQESCLLNEASGKLALSEKTLALKFPIFEMKGKDHWNFDLRLEEPTWDILRLKGSFIAEEIEEGHALLNFTFAQEFCEFFGSPLSISQLTTKDLEKVEKIEFSCKYSLPSFFSAFSFLMKFSQGFSDSFLTKYREEMAGDIDFFLRYGFGADSYLHIDSENLSCLGKKIEKGELFARILPNSIAVEKCQLGDFLGTFHIEGKPGKYKLSQMQGKWGEGFSFSLDGYQRDHKWDFRCKQFYVDLAKVQLQNGYPFLQYPLKGELNGKGCLSLKWGSENIEWDMDLDFLPKDIFYQGLEFKNQGTLHLLHSTSQDFQLAGLNFSISNKEKGIFLSDCKVGTLSQSKGSKKWVLKDFLLHLPSNFYSFLEAFGFSREKLASSLNGDLFSFLREMQIQGNATFVSDLSFFEVALPELFIPLESGMERLENVFFVHENKSSYFKFSYPEISSDYQALLSISTSPKVHGDFTLYEKSDMPTPLTFFWSWDGSGIKINQIEGEFCGIEACFYENTGQTSPLSQSLTGNLKVDFSKAAAIFPKKFKNALQKYQLGNGYELRGRLDMPSDWKKSSFLGILSGKSFEFYGCEFKTLLSGLDASLDQLFFYDLKMSDSAGMVKIPTLSLKKEKLEGWHLSLPLLKMEEIRPSLLQKIGQPLGEIQPLVIRNLLLKDLEGNLSDPKSFSGNGYLSFINSFKREHTVFDIPSDVLGRIFGLDLELLIPVTGKLEYEVEEGKVIFTSLKDSYSENNRSKFFLVEKGPPFMDFDGNLSLNITMKQYVLFTFTRNFMLSIGGNLGKPTFQLKRKLSFIP